MLARLRAGKNDQRDQIIQRDDEDDGDDEIKNQQLGFFPGLILSREEVHWFVESLNTLNR